MKTRLLLILISIFLPTSFVFGDASGRLNISVNNIDDQKPIIGANISIRSLKSSAREFTLSSDQEGMIRTPLLEPELYEIQVSMRDYKTSKRLFLVIADAEQKLQINLEPLFTTIVVESSMSLLRDNDTSNSSSRDFNFTKKFPVAAQNPQQLTGILISNPGFVQDSANQVHPRGEHSAISMYLQGYQLGGAAQGRFGPLIDPQSLENIEILTGGFAPEYAGSAAILNASIRSGTVKPFANIEIGKGSYETQNFSFSLGGQNNNNIAGSNVGENSPENFSYFLSGSSRTTKNALEAPQPDIQAAHNEGNSHSVLSRLDYASSSSDKFTLMLSASPAKTQIANRTGLSKEYSPYGQGYGFGGELSAEEALSQGIISQDKAGQDIYQHDENNFAVLQWKHEISETLTSLISLGADESKLSTLNNNPHIDIHNLPENSSIEYNPEVHRNAHQKQISGSLTFTEKSHIFKFGGQYSDESTNDSYMLIPASQRAADELLNIDPRLITPNFQPLQLISDSSGYYSSMYFQDTWEVFDDITSNYGVRYDAYSHHEIQTGDKDFENQFSPRINLSYAITPTWIARGSYNRLFIEPPLAQGAIIGKSIKPERVHQYELSLEHEFASLQKVKLAYYQKNIKDQVDTGLLIPSTQIGLYTSVNLDEARVHGLEFSYDLLPKNNFGLSAYGAYAYSIAKPKGFDNTGEPVEAFNDHDQRHTISSGIAYTFSQGAQLGADVYFGSGAASSALEELGTRESRSRIDLSISSSPKLIFGKGGIRLTISNLLDDRSLINFNSPFSGTRFQQGMMIMTSLYFDL